MPPDWAIQPLAETVIRVGFDKQPTRAEQTAGQLYAATLPGPIIRCPNCGSAVSHIGDPTPVQQGPTPKKGTIHLPQCPVSLPRGLKIPTLIYVAGPCGCRISHLWAAAFTVESHAREAGAAPKAVDSYFRSERNMAVDQYQKLLQDLYERQTRTADPVIRARLADWITFAADTIMRLCPGPHNLSSETGTTTRAEDFGYPGSYPMPKRKVAPKEVAAPVEHVPPPPRDVKKRRTLRRLNPEDS